MSGPEVGEPDEKVDHLGLQDRREVKMYLASVDETSQTVVYSDSVTTLDLHPPKEKCECTALNTPHTHTDNSLLITPFGIYLFPPMIDGFLITTMSSQYHIKDIALVSLPYRNESESGESDVVWRANDVVVHFLDSSCLWLQTRPGQRSLVAEVLSDTYEALMGMALEMHQPDCDELSQQIVGLGTAAEKTLDDMIAGFRAEAQLRMKTVSMQGWLYYTSCLMPETENGPIIRPPSFQMRYVALSSSDRLYIFRSSAELEATRCVSPNFNSRKATYNLPTQHARKLSYNLPSPAPVMLNTKKKPNNYATLKPGQVSDAKLADEANGASDTQSIVLDLGGAACLWAKDGFDVIETRHVEKSTIWTYKSKKGSTERLVHLFASVPSDKNPEGPVRAGLGLAHATSSLGFALAQTDEKAGNVLWVSRIERAIYNKVGRVFKQEEQDLRILKLIREEALKPEPKPVVEAKETKTDSKAAEGKTKTKEELEKERDLALYSIKTLNELTNDPFGKELLWKFCRAQFNEENMKYLEAVEEYEAVFKDPNQSNKSVVTHGRRMCDQFFADDAPCLLNISSGLRTHVLDAFKENAAAPIERPPANVFHATTQEIYKLLNTNSFKLFSKSEYHQQWIDYRKECVAQEEQKKKTLHRLKSSLMGTWQPRKAKLEEANDSSTTTTSAVIRIPGRFFEHAQLQSVQIAFHNDATVQQIIKLVIPQLLSIPGARPAHLLPERFGLFRLDGREMFSESQSLVSQVPPGAIEVLLKEAHVVAPPPQPLVVETTNIDSSSYSELWGEWDARETVKTRRRAVLEERPRVPAAAATSTDPEHPSFASLLQQLQGVLAKNRPPLTTNIDRESLTLNPGEDYSKLLHDHLQLLIRTATRVSSQDTHSSLASPSASSCYGSSSSSSSSASSSASSSSSSSSYASSSASSASSLPLESAALWRPRTPSLTGREERSRSHSGSGRGRPLEDAWMSPARKHSISDSGSRARSLSRFSVSSERGDRERGFSFSAKGDELGSSAALAARLRPVGEHEARSPRDIADA